jgi:uncharacterized OB-fold protein
MTTPAPSKPKPNITESIRPFWEAVAKHRFVLMRCQKCQEWYWPAAYCRFHENEPFYGNMKWEEASGQGRVFAFNIHRKAMHPAFKTPYVYALIELTEGPMFGANIIDCEPEDVSIGMPVEVAFVTESDGTVLPQFRRSSIVCEPA